MVEELIKNLYNINNGSDFTKYYSINYFFLDCDINTSIKRLGSKDRMESSGIEIS